MITCLSDNNSLIQELIGFLRDKDLHHDREKFRNTIEKIGFLIGYELSKHLTYINTTVKTPLGAATYNKLAQQPIVGSILRAGLPLHTGMLKAFPAADNCFIAAYRKHASDGSFQIQLDYLACPDLSGRTFILTDPMLATGSSLICTLEKLFEKHKPDKLHIVSVFAAQPGLEKVRQAFPDASIWTAVVDPELNQQKFIIPGLGDAGDLSFGECQKR